MSDWHTEAAHYARKKQRAEQPAYYVDTQLHVWYHCTFMPGWEQIAREQLSMLRHFGLGTGNRDVIHVGTVGEASGINHLTAIAAQADCRIAIEIHSANIQQYEHLTMSAMWEAACAHDTYMYLHTKGASQPWNGLKVHWRRAMQAHVVAKWPLCLSHLSYADIAAANWWDGHPGPHSPGNFWMARGDWLANLGSLAEISGPPGLGSLGEPMGPHALRAVGCRPTVVDG